jgi:methanogenic corrinoid protein MtbC1
LNEWECGSLEIHKERQACQICRRVIDQLRQVTRISNARFSALGGTLSDDYYELPTLMIETVLRDHGWNAMSLGTNLPGSAFFGAVEAEKPDLVWLSLSHVADRARTVADVNGLWDSLDSNVPLIVGGRALTEEMRRDIRYTAFRDTVGQLEDFLQSYHRNRTGSETNPSLN